MIKKLKKLFYKFFDYKVVGEYWDNDGKGHMTKKYIRKYHLRKNKNY